MPLEAWRVIYDVDDRDQVVLVLTVRRKRGPETYSDVV
jgi:mRNA-degrading endonuclease RelE of RelBE toxin-antitoxin system